MMRRIVESSLRFRLLVVAFAAAMMVFAVRELPDAPVDVLPEFEPTLVEVQTEALGLSAAEVEAVENVEFLEGQIESIPLPDASVDVIISNCVINLSADKDRVLGEAFRVLRPGGRFAVSEVVVRGEVLAEIRRSVELWIGLRGRRAGRG